MFCRCKSLTEITGLPATELAQSCYSNMFSSCSSLTTAPQLPATTLAEGCYNSMFSHCISLTIAPQLIATELAAVCYGSMFSYCTSLVTAPELPATTLTESCYTSMFFGCTYLTIAPELPVKTLVPYCYSDMFYNCSSLTTAPELPATTLARNCYSNMFYGCTSLTKAPELPAIVLTEYCYSSMFHSCTSLITAPELPATTLADYCYVNMFSNCTSLNYIKCLATDISSHMCTYEWVNNVAPTGIFVKHPDMNNWEIGENGIPTGWVVKAEIEYSMVDLGLSVKWADRNVGAKTPQDNGLYFSWGNVDGHAVDENGNVIDGYSFDRYTYSNTSGGQYTGDELDPEYDAATVNMGSDWRMPVNAETVELVENTDHYYIGEDGNILLKAELDGSIKLRSICFVKKGEAFAYDNRSNFIEIPFAGSCKGSLLGYVGQQGFVWLRSVGDEVDGANDLYFDNTGLLGDGSSNFNDRLDGQSVRGVKNN